MTERPTVRECEICHRQGLLVPKMSLLDPYTYDACSSCWDNHAESWLAVGNAVGNEAGAWAKIDLTIRATVTVWIGEDYVSIPEGARRRLTQMLVPCTPTEEELEDEGLMRTMEGIKRNRKTMDQAAHRQRRRLGGFWRLDPHGPEHPPIQIFWVTAAIRNAVQYVLNTKLFKPRHHPVNV